MNSISVAILSNYFNHHQKPICDALFSLSDGHFCFIATERISNWRKELGYEDITAPYVIELDSKNLEEVKRILSTVDVVITDAEHIELTQRRYDDGKLTFRNSERLFKSNLRYLKAPIHFLKAFRTRKMYLLCSSAFAARDYRILGFYKNRSFKWGYFPQSKFYPDNNELLSSKETNSILWAGRLINWKHPEAAIEVARRLKQEHFDFRMEIIGAGELRESLERRINLYCLSNHVSLLGAMSPEEVRSHMEKSEVFIFSSDKGEGWGAVLNESMNSGCAVVASDMIGSAPYLISHGKNGYLFKNRDWNDLYEKVKTLILDSTLRRNLALSAIRTIQSEWDAQHAANSLISLASGLIEGNHLNITSGPCSPA